MSLRPLRFHRPLRYDPERRVFARDERPLYGFSCYTTACGSWQIARIPSDTSGVTWTVGVCKVEGANLRLRRREWLRGTGLGYVPFRTRKEAVDALELALKIDGPPEPSDLGDGDRREALGGSHIPDSAPPSARAARSRRAHRLGPTA